MYICDYMSKDLITVGPSTSMMQAADLMDEKDINRLPVIKNDKVIGLVTKETIIANRPSQATSLSAHEVNYLLEKTRVEEIMEIQYLTIGPKEQVEKAAQLMLQHHVGVLLVMEDTKLLGLITDKDIFKAFAEISGYTVKGAHLVIELAKDKQGVIEEVGDALVETNKNLTHMTVYHVDQGIRVALHIDDQETDSLKRALENRGYHVMAIYLKD